VEIAIGEKKKDTLLVEMGITRGDNGQKIKGF
jgi:hypothetical protein